VSIASQGKDQLQPALQGPFTAGDEAATGALQVDEVYVIDSQRY